MPNPVTLVPPPVAGLVVVLRLGALAVIEAEVCPDCGKPYFADDGGCECRYTLAGPAEEGGAR
jgi:hypothetical protein